MAIGYATLGSGVSSSNVSSYQTSAAYQPTSNALVLALVVHSDAASEATVPTFSGNGLTWVQVGTSMPFNTVATNLNRVTLFRAMGSSPTSTTGTASFGDNCTGCAIFVCEFTGVDTSGTNGSGAIVQSVSDNGNAELPVITLAAIGGSGEHAVYGGFGNDVVATDLVVETNWVEDFDAAYSIPATGIYVTHRLATTDNTVGWTDPALDWGGIAVEIKVAPPATGLVKGQMLLLGVGA